MISLEISASPVGLKSPGSSSSGLWFGGISVVVLLASTVVLFAVVLCTIRSLLLDVVKLALLENTCFGSTGPSERLLNAIIEFVSESEWTEFSVEVVVVDVTGAGVTP